MDSEESRGALLKELQTELQEFHAFWERGGVDKEHGGFMCSLAHDGTRLEDTKFVWYQGRGLWVYSHLYRCHGRDEAHRRVADKAFEFLMTRWAPQSSAGEPPPAASQPREWAVEAGRLGAVEAVRGFEPLSVATSGYGGAFVGEGMIEYHRATGNADALALALAELDRFVALVDNPAHESDTHLPEPVVGSHCLGHSMIVTSLTRQLLAAPRVLEAGSVAEARVEALSRRAAEEIDVRFFHPGYRLLSECLSPTYERLADGNEDFVYLGHGIETLWMLMAEALRRGDGALYTRSAARFRRHVEVAWDRVYGGVFRGLAVREHRFLIDGDCKVKWAQDEVMVGCALMAANPAGLSPADVAWAERTFASIRGYIQERFVKPLRDRSLPYVLVGGDRLVTFQERYVNAGQPGAKSRKEHYHHPRALMLVAEVLAQLCDGRSPVLL